MEDNLHRHATGDGKAGNPVNKAYLAPQLFTGDDIFLKNSAVLVQQDTVIGVVSAAEVPDGYALIHLPENALLAPAYIDIQIYGAGERLFATYPDAESLRLLQQHCLAGGCTLHLPTIATNSLVFMHRGIDAVKKYWHISGEGVHGLHLEGPWINAEKKGAHLAQHIHAPTLEEVKEIIRYGEGCIKMITLAPECCSGAVIDYLLTEGIVVSAGHSSATFEEATAAFNNGIGAATHLYNAMTPLQHRAPGMVGAILQHPSVKCSIIPDGHHVSWPAVQIAKRIMSNRLFAITDAVTTTTEGPYQHLPAGDKYECNGVLSGSALTMHRCMLNLTQHAGIGVPEALRMCSLYPAEVLGLQHKKGKIAACYSAHFVVLDANLQLVQTISGAVH